MNQKVEKSEKKINRFLSGIIDVTLHSLFIMGVMNGPQNREVQVEFVQITKEDIKVDPVTG